MIFLAFFILLLPVSAKAQEQRPAASPQLTRAEMEEFLLKSNIVSVRPRGEYQSRITLDDGKRRHDANVETEDGTTSSRRNYRFNMTAYELDKALELNLVPPTVARTVNGRPASVTWWVDDVLMTEMDRRRKKIEPPDPESWNKQMQAVRVFDELISNRYRNLNPERFERPDGTVTPFDASWVELLITRDWRIWLIDHTETFRVRKQLEYFQSLTVIEIQRDQGGRIASAVFAGKGWGHGVGLCQVGAYGMAVRGADYKEILGHYYPGISIARAPSESSAAAGSR